MFGELYAQARERTLAAREQREALQESPEEYLEKIKDVRATLKKQFLEGLEDKILDAAAKGFFTADAMTFNGNDHIDDISVLFVLKGQRPMTPPPPPGCPGPLFDELREELKPFDVVHDWDGISSGNRLVVRWK